MKVVLGSKRGVRGQQLHSSFEWLTHLCLPTFWFNSHGGLAGVGIPVLV